MIKAMRLRNLCSMNFLQIWHKRSLCAPDLIFDIKWGSPSSFCCYGDRNIMPPRVEKNIILRFGISMLQFFVPCRGRKNNLDHALFREPLRRQNKNSLRASPGSIPDYLSTVLIEGSLGSSPICSPLARSTPSVDLIDIRDVIQQERHSGNESGSGRSCLGRLP